MDYGAFVPPEAGEWSRGVVSGAAPNASDARAGLWHATARYSHILTVKPRGEWKDSTLQVSWRATHRPLPVPARGAR